MQTHTHELVGNKFNDLIHSLTNFSDDLKISCAEASLDGDFTLVKKLSADTINTQDFIKEITKLSDYWKRGIQRPENTKRKNIASKKHSQKNPRTKLCVTVDGKKIQEKTAAETFSLAIENMGFEQVFKLGKEVSGIALLSKSPTTSYQSQKKRGDWYITTHASTKQMKIILEEMAQSLNKDIRINILNK